MCSQVAAYGAAGSQAVAQQAARSHSAACAVWVHNLQCRLLTLCSAAHCMLTGCSAAHSSLTLCSSELTPAPSHSLPWVLKETNLNPTTLMHSILCCWIIFISNRYKNIETTNNRLLRRLVHCQFLTPKDILCGQNYGRLTTLQESGALIVSLVFAIGVRWGVTSDRF